MVDNKRVIGIDVGGTFTDVFLIDEQNKRVDIEKVPTSPEDQSVGFLQGLQSGVSNLSQISTIIHGTTVATNALIERKGARAGVITTAGFRDVLEMRRRDRPNTWGLWGTFEPVVSRDRRLEVDERVLADGKVKRRVDVEEVRKVARRLLEQECESVAIVFINSYANDINEQFARKAVESVWPNTHITCSSEILREIREFERASTTTLNAILQPTVGHYIANLENILQEYGYGGEVLIVQSNGGVMSLETTRVFPVKTALSGPAAGVIAAAEIGKASGYSNLISCDMGGTSFDVALVSDGKSAISSQSSIGFGMIIRSPMVEITTIGAGGGSIAKVDAGGLLIVGPESAGANPGPACYGFGNPKPTVTDANVVLGRINPYCPIGGGLSQLDIDAANDAIQRHIGDPLGMDTTQAADAILKVTNANMANAIRLVSIERGFDPRIFAVMPFGGGGGLHACALMRDVGFTAAVVPRFPGVTSALGCVIADMRHDHVYTINEVLDDLDLGRLESEMALRRAEGHSILDNSGVVFEAREDQIELDMLYVGQTHTLPVRLPIGGLKKGTRFTRELIFSSFEESYLKSFGRILSDIPVRVMNLRTTVIGQRPKFDFSLLAPSCQSSMESSFLMERRVYTGSSWEDIKVFDRLKLPNGASIEGPAILEQTDTTIYIEPKMIGTVDKIGNLLITVN